MTNPLTVRDIVTQYLVEYLRANGYDGLFDYYGIKGSQLTACGCLLDNNFFHCEEYGLNCVPAYKVPCVPADDCPVNCWGDCIAPESGLCMSPIKPSTEEAT